MPSGPAINLIDALKTTQKKIAGSEVFQRRRETETASSASSDKPADHKPQIAVRE